MPTMIVYTCGNCGKPFERQKGKHESNKTGLYFCSNDCVKVWRRGENHPQWKGAKKTFTCIECDAVFESYPDHRRGEKIFCSISCHGNWMTKNRTGSNNSFWKGKIQVPCGDCGEMLERYPHQAKSGRRSFCNASCRSNWLSRNNVGANNVTWKGGYKGEYYGQNWLRQARRARQRDTHKCKHCGISEKKLGRKLDVHHIKPFREFGYIVGENDNYREANKLTNLISLCPACHTRAEHAKIPIQPSLL